MPGLQVEPYDESLPSRLIWPELTVPSNLGVVTDNESAGDIAQKLMAVCLEQAPSLLYAEYSEGGEIPWIVRNGEGERKEIYRSPDCARFRMALARFGAGYLDGQLYGGYVQRVMVFQNQRWMCRIYMSNLGASGFWIRAYAMHPI